MKTNFFKYSVLLLALVSATVANAQKKPVAHTIHSSTGYTTEDGKEHVTDYHNGKEYRLTFIGGKLTAMFIDDEKIPESKFSDYSAEIARIKEQMRKDKIQAKKDQAQALLDEAQAKRDQIQAEKDQIQAKRDQEQAMRDQEQAKKDQLQADKERENAKLDQEQARKDQEQAIKDQAQAKLDQEQVLKDQAQAKIDQREAEEDQRQMKLMISDLIKDGIIPNEKSLSSVTLSQTEMTVNDKKMPDDIFKRYKAKYTRFARGTFSYGNEGNFRGIHMSREKK